MPDSLACFPETFFAWWNGIIQKDQETGEDEFSRFFTADAEIITNEKLVCKGPADIARHFMGVKEKTSACQVRLPMNKIFVKDDHIFVHYLIDASFEEDRQLIAVMGYMHIDHGKIKLSRQLQHVMD